VARPSDEEPEGLVYQPGLFSHEEETRLLDELESLRFDPIVLHGRAARRTGRHFGLDYDRAQVGSTRASVVFRALREESVLPKVPVRYPKQDAPKKDTASPLS
jgi:hypothetical protein